MTMPSGWNKPKPGTNVAELSGMHNQDESRVPGWTVGSPRGCGSIPPENYSPSTYNSMAGTVSAAPRLLDYRLPQFKPWGVQVPYCWEQTITARNGAQGSDKSFVDEVAFMRMK